MSAMLVVDANIVVSSIMGRHVEAVIVRLAERGVDLAIPAPQLLEAHEVMTGKLGFALEDVVVALQRACAPLRRLLPREYESAEPAARARLHEHGQVDWPVLAAAIAFDAAVWSNDKDFFGVGVPVWSTRNVHLAEA